jgi:hypothetical protein
MTAIAPGRGMPPADYLDALELDDAAAASLVSSAPHFAVKSDTEIEHLPPIAWLAKDILPLGAVTALYGAPDSGKSFLAIDLALSLAIGSPWLGRPVTVGSTLYVAAEGWAGLGSRVRAWKEQRSLGGRALGVEFVTDTVNLLHPPDVAKILATAERTEDNTHQRVVLVVIDTLAQCMIGGDENEAQDMSRVMAAAQLIRQKIGATVLFQHHTRKDSDEERGSTALRGAVDTLLLVEETDEGRQLVCRKQKDAEQFVSIPFRLVAGHGSCIVQGGPSGGSSREQAGTDELTPKRLQALRALGDAFTARGATTTEWMRASGLPDRTFYHVRKWAVDNGYASESARGGRYTLTSSGRYAITAKLLPSSLPSPNSAAALASSAEVGGNEKTATMHGSSPNTRASDDPYWSDLMSTVDERLAMREDA